MHGIDIDYPDKAPEGTKQRLVDEAERKIAKNKNIYLDVADSLRTLVGKSQLTAFERKIVLSSERPLKNIR